MKCVICKTGEVVSGPVEAEIKVGRDRLVVTVDAEACGECGEQYYSAAVLRHLEHIRREFAAKAISPVSVGTVYQCRGLRERRPPRRLRALGGAPDARRRGPARAQES